MIHELSIGTLIGEIQKNKLLQKQTNKRKRIDSENPVPKRAKISNLNKEINCKEWSISVKAIGEDSRLMDGYEVKDKVIIAGVRIQPGDEEERMGKIFKYSRIIKKAT